MQQRSILILVGVLVLLLTPLTVVVANQLFHRYNSVRKRRMLRWHHKQTTLVLALTLALAFSLNAAPYIHAFDHETAARGRQSGVRCAAV